MPGLISGEQQRISSSHLLIPQFQDDYYYDDDEDTDQRNTDQFACDGVQERTKESGRDIKNVMEAHGVSDTEEPVATELEKTTSKESNTVRRTRVVAQPKPKPASLFTIEPLRELTHYGKVDQIMKASHDDIEQETNIEAPSSTSMRDGPVPSHWYHVPPRDYELSPQELNARADGFITKFKRNLTMQREDSFNRLLALVGKK
ncbi:hypothetical protein KP509_07G083500 [Ceratopteris richardii]|nr:hypothetical protein KP509_07G083500 [Ceratopteris richardii]